MESFTSIKPSNEKLNDYIESYYFHKSDSKNSVSKIIFFPNTKNALTIYKNADFSLNNNHIKIARIINKSDTGYVTLYGGIQKNHIISEINTPFDKIGIIFKPLGINYFISDKLENILSKQEDYKFSHFNNKIEDYLDKVYETEDLQKRIQLLESFLISVYNHDFHDETILMAINLIENSSNKLKIIEVANELKISEKTLNRKFKSHLNCTPKHYQKVFLFRKVLEDYISRNGKITLTDLTYKNFYYDQSDLIKSFKTFTNKNPLKLFKELKDLGNNIFWIK
ncbi:helix-turn-helix domain-containing protein [Flavobacterium sp. TBRC 19031]|uniref:helix-turn-helix domain-containing protein n=1 Tax=Flavobacterium mekongense TaxID=3379707 RepID=UPI00399B197A